MDILDKLLGGQARVRLLRLFLLNADMAFEAKEIRKRIRVSSTFLRRELSALTAIKFIKRGKKGYQLSRSFEFLVPLRALLLSTDPFQDEEISRRFRGGGTIKLVIVAGVFIQNLNNSNLSAPVDILIVGDRLRRGKIERALHDMESELGKELAYAIFETSEFKYRMEVYDKFVRDILDYPHRALLDKIGVV